MRLEGISEPFREKAADALEHGDWKAFFAFGHHDVAMGLWYRNQAELTKLGVYEESLLHAWSRQEHADDWIGMMLSAMLKGDKSKFVGLAPLPTSAVESDGKVTVYRGVGKPTREQAAMARRFYAPEYWRPPIERGLSWTLNIEIAKRFAVGIYGNGVVLETRVDPDAIWAYIDSRQERECVIPLVPKKPKIRIVGHFAKTDVFGAASAHPQPPNSTAVGLDK